MYERENCGRWDCMRLGSWKMGLARRWEQFYDMEGHISFWAFLVRGGHVKNGPKDLLSVHLEVV